MVSKSGRRIVRPRVIAALAAALILATQLPTTAHDIPNDVTVQAFLKPQGQRLHCSFECRSARVAMSIFRHEGPVFGPGQSRCLASRRGYTMDLRQCRVVRRRYPPQGSACHRRSRVA